MINVDKITYMYIINWIVIDFMGSFVGVYKILIILLIVIIFEYLEKCILMFFVLYGIYIFVR